MRDGAADFLVKPVDEAQLQDAVVRALALDVPRRHRRDEEWRASERWSRLTRREREFAETADRAPCSRGEDLGRVNWLFRGRCPSASGQDCEPSHRPGTRSAIFRIECLDPLR